MVKQRETHLVTGGGGYPGFRLGQSLASKGFRVILLDNSECTQKLSDCNMHFIKADIRSLQDLLEAFDGVDCVYHMASYGMSGREQLNRAKIDEINVQGTKNVITACIEKNVPRLVYTSTYNVVFGGQCIVNGDESLPYFPLDKHPDHYSRTKAIAEKEVLTANGTKLSTGTLHTCALRLAGVYGPGEQRHLPRIVSYIERGLFAMTYGSIDSRVDFLHVDNLVQAHCLAAECLSGAKNHIAAGQVYFISDGKPINNFEFFRPLVEALGYKYPQRKLPVWLIYWTAFFIEIIHSIVAPIYNFQPLLTRTEVFKTGVTHWFNIGKAHKELGYVPLKQNDMNDVVQWYLERGFGRKASQQTNRPFKQLLIDVILVLIFVFLLLSFIPFVL